MPADTHPSSDQPIRKVLSEVTDADQDGRISVNEVLKTFENRSLGVILLVLGLLAALPLIGAIPGMSITTGALILLAIARDLWGGGRLRMPGRLGRLSVPRDRFERGVRASRTLIDPVDRIVRPRLSAFVEPPLARAVILSAIAVLALTMFPLAFVPWGVTAPSFGIVAFALAMVARDGVLALIGYAMIAGTIATGVAVL